MFIIHHNIFLKIAFPLVWIIFVTDQTLAAENSSILLLNKCTDFRETSGRKEFNKGILQFIKGAFDIKSDVQRIEIKTTVKPLRCTDPKRLNFSTPLSTNITYHFTKNGYFHDGRFYYEIEDYCIESLLEMEMELRLCPLNEKCIPGKSIRQASSYCIPKCCAIDEVLVYWNFTCTKIPDQTEPLNWKPQSGEKNAEINRNESYFYLQKLKCDTTGQFTFSHVNRPIENNKYPPDEPTRMNLLEKSGPKFYADGPRRWKDLPEDYCLDRFLDWGVGRRDGGVIEENAQVLLYCESNPSSYVDTTFRSILYTITLFISAVFLLIAFLIHLVIIHKLKLNGFVNFSYITSMLCTCVTAGLAHFLSWHPEYRGGFSRAPFCMAVAISSHYFILSSFFWLTILNFHMWHLFRGVTTSSSKSKGITNLILYSFVGWGLPFILIVAFVTVNEAFRDPMSEVPVPDYASSHGCYVSIRSRGYYIYAPIAILILISIIFIILILKLMFFRTMQKNKIEAKRSMSGSSQTFMEKYDIPLLLKLFVMMGIVWFEELLSWLYYPENKPECIFILDCLANFLQAAAVSFILCVNRQVFDHVGEKFPIVARWSKRFWKTTS